MKYNVKSILILAIAGTLLFTVQSCKKRKLNKETTTSEDNSIAEASFDDIFKITNEAADDEGGLRLSEERAYSFGSCATVTLTPDLPDTTFPKTMIVDFGTSNCQGNDNVNRRGKIKAVFTGKYRDAGTKITVTPENYYVNDYKVEGTKTITNNGRNSAGNLNYTITVDGKVTTPESDIITYESNRNREWIEGESTTWVTSGLSGIFDDIYSITGNGGGITREGRAYTIEVTKPLIIQVGCRWIKEGTLEIVPEELKTRTVDFGDRNEGCNNDATVTIGKKTYDIKMR